MCAEGTRDRHQANMCFEPQELFSGFMQPTRSYGVPRPAPTCKPMCIRPFVEIQHDPFVR